MRLEAGVGDGWKKQQGDQAAAALEGADLVVQPKETIKELVGHEDGDDNGLDITFGVYTPGASEAQRVACVESVKLPPQPAPESR